MEQVHNANPDNMFIEDNGLNEVSRAYLQRDRDSKQTLLQKNKHWMFSMVGLNCMAFAAWQLYPQLMSRNFLLCKRNLQTGRYHVVVTSQWSHKGLIHLAFSMYLLYRR